MEQNRTQLSRAKNRSVENKNDVYAIIDEGLICHVSVIRDNYPVVLPSNYGRYNDELILHGSYEGPFHRAIAAADSICVSIALLDGLVMGKSAYNHSVNYRSVVLYGKAREITDKSEKLKMLKAIIDHVIKNRWDSLRAPSDKELDATMVLSIPIKEYSAKTRMGGPTVALSDENIPVWSGVLPLSLDSGELQGDKHSLLLKPDNNLTEYNRIHYRKK
jgi:hypothetical protein